MAGKDDLTKIQNTLIPYENLNFVQRILHPDKYPTLDLGNGDYATHKMAWTQFDDKYFVYPTVVYDKKKNVLNQLDPYNAIQYAIQHKEYMPFKTPEEADWFSKNYKMIWNKK